MSVDKNLLQFVLKFKNDTDQAVRAAGNNLTKLAADTDKVTAAQNKAGAQAKSLDLSFGKLAATAGAALAAVGLAQGVQGAVNTLASFEQAMSTVKAVTQATAAEMTEMRTIAKQLGASTRFSATDAAEGMIQLGQAGFTTAEIMQSISPTLNLAQAGGLGLASAAGIASGTLRGFNLQASESGRVMDILAKAAIISNADVTTLGEGLKYAAPAATALGIELEETIAILGTLANANISGGQGGRGFQSFTLAFVTQSKAIKKLIGDYDLAEDSVTSLVKRLVDAGITTQQVIDIFSGENVDIFGVLSKAAVKTAGGIEEMRAALKNAAGTSAEVAKIMDANLNGAILNAQSGVEGFMIAIGEAGATELLVRSLTAISSLMSGLTGIMEGLSDATRNADGTLTTLGATLDALLRVGLVTGAMIGITAAVRAASAAFLAMGAAAGLSWKAVLGPIGLVVVGVTAAGAIFDILASTFKEVRDVAKSLGEFINGIVSGIAEMLNLKDTAEEAQLKAVLGASAKAVDDYTAAYGRLGSASGEAAAVILKDFEAQGDALATMAKQEKQKLADMLADREAYAAAVARTNPANVGPRGMEGMARSGPNSQVLADMDKQIAALQASTARMDQVLTTGGILEYQAELGIAFTKAAAAADGLRVKQEALDAETQKALDAIILKLGERQRASAAILAQGDLEGQQLIQQTLLRETDEALRQAGIVSEGARASILRGMLPTIEAIALAEQQRAEAVEDDKIVKSLKGQNNAYLKLEERVKRLRDESKLTQGDVDAVLANSSYQKGATELLGQLGPAQQAEAAKREAIATNAALLAQFEQYLKDGTVKFTDELGIRNAIAAKLDQDLGAVLAAQKAARDSLDAAVGFGAANDPLLAGSLEQDLARISAEEDAKRALLLEKYNLGVVDYQGYKARLEAIDADSARKRKAAETAQTTMLLAAAQQTGESITGVLKDTLGEQSALYKISFAATKAFAIAQSIVNIQTALSSAAASMPFPYNLGAIATVAAETASIISTISSVALAMKDGGHVVGRGGPRDDLIPAMLSNGEFVMNAEATKRNRALLEALNSGRRYADGGYVAMQTGGSGSMYRGTPGTEINVNNTFNLGNTNPADPVAQREMLSQIDRQSRISARAAIREEMRANGMLASVRG